jgi:hypothetical protein
VTFSLPQDAIDFLKAEADRTHVSMADVVRRSLANEKYLKDAQAKGAEVLLKEDGKRLTKLVFTR